MTKSFRAYPEELKRRIIALHRGGRSLIDLAEEFGINRQTIHMWSKQDEIDSGDRDEGLTTDERGELVRLRRLVKELRVERDILKKSAAWFARESVDLPNTSTE